MTGVFGFPNQKAMFGRPTRSQPLTAREARLSGEPLTLTSREFDLLLFFARHPGRVFNRMELLDQVWGDHVYIEERTVDVHIRRLRLALEPFGQDSLIETVRGSGYRLAAPRGSAA